MTRVFATLPFICAVGLCWLSFARAETDAAESTSPVSAEVLVFVDVSGSMKLNDPQNIRAPAIRMLSGMAPNSARVGVYLFGTTVRELVPFARATDDWKQQADKASNRYRSRDLYTNIEAALSTTETFWSDDDNISRSVILLTDGIVDIDKNPQISQRSRQRILDPVLQSLKQQRTNVHTIALSDNADHELLEQLAIATDGKYYQVDDAGLLQRTFMHLFEQSAPQDTLPLTDNQFIVDDSVSELTLLVFRKPGASAAQVKTPTGELYSLDTRQAGLKWKHDTGYDLISIEHPQAGAWQLIADIDPDNRAMVVTDLKLISDQIPASILNGEQVAFSAWLEDKGEVITRQNFLQLIKGNVSTVLANGEQYIKPLDAPDEQGIIQHSFGPEWHNGESELVIRVDGETFMREKRFALKVFSSPITVNWQELPAAELQQNDKPAMPKNILNPETGYQAESGWQINVTALTDLIDIQQSSLSAVITTQTDVEHQLIAEVSSTGWQIEYLPDEPGKNTLAIKLNTTSPSGRDIVIEETPIELGEFFVFEESVEKPLPVVEPDIKLPSSKQVLVPVIVGNLIFVLLFFIWKSLKRMRASATIYPEEVL